VKTQLAMARDIAAAFGLAAAQIAKETNTFGREPTYTASAIARMIELTINNMAWADLFNDDDLK
jgi:hypothetical protein